ncbi:MAG: glycosyltransferase [Candidatus Azobacteroides sp.]|nr:glycosyltransferase [Candidatus Azobacteroides sp.]
MRILLINKFYYPRGGDCIYTNNLEALLKQKGHEVAIFSMQHSDNWGTPYSYSFPSEVKFSFSLDLLETIRRPLGSKEVEKKFICLLHDFQPEIIHLNNIHSQISPIVAEIAYKKGLKVVWTLHDFKLLCPRYDCLRNEQPCQLCFSNKIYVLKYKCMKNSLFASTLAYWEALKWNKEKLERYTDVFICPSVFMKSKMLAGGFSESKLMVLPNFVFPEKKDSTTYKQMDNYYCYVGRISEEKGIETLLHAAQQMPYLLKIAGKGPLFDDLQSRYASDKIEFLGYLDQEKVKSLIKNARFSVIPSECYENNPLSGIESLCLGIPILGANIGGIPELIEKNRNGLLFESGNQDDLKNKIEEMYHSTFDSASIAQKAQRDYSSENYYTSLMNIYCDK